MLYNECNVGDRIELHPATDYWMMGARYGEVIARHLAYPGPAYYVIKLDKIKKPVRIKLDDIGKKVS